MYEDLTLRSFESEIASRLDDSVESGRSGRAAVARLCLPINLMEGNR